MFIRLSPKLLNKSLTKAGINDKVQAASAIELARVFLKKEFEAEFCRSAAPLYIKNKSLIIKVSESLIAAEIKKKEKSLLIYIENKSNVRLRRIVYIS